jgi:hypothetical protein
MALQHTRGSLHRQAVAQQARLQTRNRSSEPFEEHINLLHVQHELRVDARPERA